MAETKKLKLAVKLDDGNLYTLGGDEGAANAVTLDTEQTITAVKTFDKLPKSTAKPADDSDLVNKSYVDAFRPKQTTRVLLNVLSDSNNWAAFNTIKFSTPGGKIIEPLYLEETNAGTAVEPLKFVFKLADDFTGNTQTKPKEFFKTYSLQEGEYFGSFTPSHLLLDRWKTHTTDYQNHPFKAYLAYLETGPNSLLPFLEWQFDGLVDELQQVDLTIGDPMNSNNYPPEAFQFVVSTGAKEFRSKVYTKAADSIGKGSNHVIKFELKALEYVTLDTAQTIAAAKTFSEVPSVTAAPKAPEHVATVGYVSDMLTAKPPFNLALDLIFAGTSSSSWIVFSNTEIKLENGKKLKCIHVDETQPTSSNAPVKCVFKLIPEDEAISTQPEKHPADFFDSYSLQEGELFGLLTYGHLLDPTWQEYSSYHAPFGSAEYGCYGLETAAPMLRISLAGLTAKVSAVSLTISGGYMPKSVQASLNGNIIPVFSDVQTDLQGGAVVLEFPLVQLTGLVTLDTAQTITGRKTFAPLPKSSVLPTDFYELVTKSYVDALVKNAQMIRIHLSSPQTGTADNPAWSGYHDLKFTLADNKHLVPLYLDETYPADAEAPVKCILKVSDTEYVAHSIQLKAAAWFDTYELKADEIEGRITYAKLLDPVKNVTNHSSHTQDKPFDNYLIKEPSAVSKLSPVVMFEFIGLPSPVKKIDLLAGDPINSGAYYPKEIKAESLSGFNTFVSKTYSIDSDGIAENTPISITFDTIEQSTEAPSFVTTNTDQEVTARKTFKVLPQSSAAPAEASDLVTKKYVDEKVAAGGGGGSSAAPGNMVTTDSAQTITEVKTFHKLPKAETKPTEDAHLANKKYVDESAAKSVTLDTAQTITAVKTFSALPQATAVPAGDADLVNKKYVDEKVGTGGGAAGNAVTLDTEQTITGLKKFTQLPKLEDYVTVVPTNERELVTKSYVDNATSNNQGYQFTIYGTLEAAGKKIYLSNLILTLENGDKLELRHYASDKQPGLNTSAYTLWSFGNTGKTYGAVNSMTETQIRSYKRNHRELLCSIKCAGAIGSKFTVDNPYSFTPASIGVTGQATDEQAIVRFEFEGSLPPITRVEFRSSTGDNRGKSFRIESKVIGANQSVEYSANFSDNNPYNIPLNPAFVADPYYLNRYGDQDVLGVVHYKAMPHLDKPVELFGLANGNTPAAMADLFGSIAVPVPEKQVIVIGNKANKTNVGDRPPYRYKWDFNLKFGDLKLTRKNPKTYADEELYLKFCGPSSDGYKGVLTPKKPDNYLSPVVEKQQPEMDAYKLEAGECWCKLGYATRITGLFNDEAIKEQEKNGSDKLKDLFLAKSQWYNYSNTESTWNENGGPKVSMRLFIYESSVVSWQAQKEVSSDPGDTLEVYSDTASKAYTLYELKQEPNYPKDVPDLQLQCVDVLGLIKALSERVKALEDAAKGP